MTFYTLQFLRFVAALIVLLFHLFLMSSGYKGVDIFFVISGFVMYYTLFARKRPNAVHFIVNRLTKIFFLYWVALAFICMVDPSRFAQLSIKILTLVPGHKSLVGVSWSLSFELYFYFVIGSIAYMIPKKYHQALFFGLIGITTATTIAGLFTDKLLHTTLNYLLGPNFWEFLLGILSAYLSITYHERIPFRLSISIAVLSLCLFLAIPIVYENPLMYVVYGLFSALVVLFFTAFEQMRSINKLAAYVFKILGDASYGIYLFGPIITLLVNPLNLSSKIIVIISTIGFSIVFNQLIENRLLTLVRNVLYTKFPKKL